MWHVAGAEACKGQHAGVQRAQLAAGEPADHDAHRLAARPGGVETAHTSLARQQRPHKLTTVIPSARLFRTPSHRAIERVHTTCRPAEHTMQWAPLALGLSRLLVLH